MTQFFTAGRIITGLFFVLAGINKLTGYSDTLSVMDAAGLPVTGLLLPLTICLELVGGVILIIGRQGRALISTALALAGFTLMTNAVFHRFWEMDGLRQQLELSLFFKNLVVCAALLMIAGAIQTPKSPR